MYDDEILTVTAVMSVSQITESSPEYSVCFQVETGLRCSAGIACNKLLAKLCSGLHKPNDQTILPPPLALVRQ